MAIEGLDTENPTCLYCGEPPHQSEDVVCNRGTVDYPLPYSISDDINDTIEVPSLSNEQILSLKFEVQFQMREVDKYRVRLERLEEAYSIQQAHVRTLTYKLQNLKLQNKNATDYKSQAEGYKKALIELLKLNPIESSSSNKTIIRILNKYTGPIT